MADHVTALVHPALAKPVGLGMITTRTHAILDYVLPLGIAALAASGRFGRPLRRLMTVGPIYHLGYTLLTKHEGGVIPIISMEKHLALDAVGALNFIGAATLSRKQPRAHRLLVAAIGAAELLAVAYSSTGSPAGKVSKPVRRLAAR